MGDDWAFLVRRRPAARLREADVHQAAPQGDLPAPVRGCPQAARAGPALPRRGPGHHGRAPLRDPLPARGRLLPPVVARSTGWSPATQAFPGPQADHGGPARGRGLHRAVRGRAVPAGREGPGVDGRPHARQLPHRDGRLLPAGRDGPRGQLGAAVDAGGSRTRRRCCSRRSTGARATCCRCPSVYTPDEASDDIVEFLEELLPSLVGDAGGVAVARDPAPAGGGHRGRPGPQRRGAAAGMPGLAARVRRRADRRRRRAVDRRLARGGASGTAPPWSATRAGACRGPGRSASRRRRRRWVLLVDADVVFPDGCAGPAAGRVRRRRLRRPAGRAWRA